MTDLKSMAIVPMHEWKVPLKYRAMLLFPSGPLGLGGAADTMVWGGGLARTIVRRVIVCRRQRSELIGSFEGVVGLR